MSSLGNRVVRMLDGLQVARLCSGERHLALSGTVLCTASPALALTQEGHVLQTSTVPAQAMTPALTGALAAAARLPSATAIRDATLATLAAAPSVAGRFLEAVECGLRRAMGRQQGTHRTAITSVAA